MDKRHRPISFFPSYLYSLPLSSYPLPSFSSTRLHVTNTFTVAHIIGRPSPPCNGWVINHVCCTLANKSRLADLKTPRKLSSVTTAFFLNQHGFNALLLVPINVCYSFFFSRIWQKLKKKRATNITRQYQSILTTLVLLRKLLNLRIKSQGYMLVLLCGTKLKMK